MKLSKEVREKVLADAKRLAQRALNHAAGIPGNPSRSVRVDVAIEWLQPRVRDEIEAHDHLVPVIGKYMDLPTVDAAQRSAEHLILRAFVERLYTEQELKRVTQG